jgi:hypothetical protein
VEILIVVLSLGLMIYILIKANVIQFSAKGMKKSSVDLSDVERNRKLFLQEFHKRYLINGKRKLH